MNEDRRTKVNQTLEKALSEKRGLSEDEKNAVRELVQADNVQLGVALAPLYLGKVCPELKDECRGPYCPKFLPTGEPGRITGGACSIALIASQVGPISNGLLALAEPRRTVIPSR